MFSEGKSLQNDPVARLHANRLDKARKEEESKKKRVAPNLTKFADKTWNKSYFKSRSISMGDASTLLDQSSNKLTNNKSVVKAKKSLHDELHSWNNNLGNGEDEIKNNNELY